MRGTTRVSSLLVGMGVMALIAPAALGAPGSVRFRPAPSAPTSLAWALPKSAAGRQLSWFIQAAPHAPLSTAEIKRHFDRAFLAKISPAEINQSLEAIPSRRPWRIIA